MMQKHKIGRSNRVARHFGSRRLIQVSVPSASIQRNSEALCDLANKFVLNGRVFEAVCAKDHTVYLLETADYDTLRSNLPVLDHLSNRGRMRLAKFMTWHNPACSANCKYVRSSCYHLSTPVLIHDPSVYSLQVVCTLFARVLYISLRLSLPAAFCLRISGCRPMSHMRGEADHDSSLRPNESTW